MIVHRDIKGSNLLVDDRGVVKLADFGTSKQFKAWVRKACMKISSSKPCVVPRTWRSRGSLESGHGVQADIWSLGCTVLQMLSPSLEDLNAISLFYLLQKIALSDIIPSFPESISQSLKIFLEQCFIREPSTQTHHNCFVRVSFRDSRRFEYSV